MSGRIIRPQPVTKLPEIGKIKVGEKAEGQNFPRSLDYFKPAGDYAPLFWGTYGEKPNLLEIVFPSDDARECCFERLELRDGAKLFADGDGETFKVWSTKEETYITMTVNEVPNLMDKLSQKVGKPWRPILTLRFMLLKVRSVMGVWSLSTHAEASSIPEIVSTFDKVKELSGGTVAGVPFDLSVSKVTSQKPGSKSSFPVLKLVPNIGVNHLEMVGQLVASGQKVRGILSEDIIERQAKLIGAPQ